MAVADGKAVRKTKRHVHAEGWNLRRLLREVEGGEGNSDGCAAEKLRSWSTGCGSATAQGNRAAHASHQIRALRMQAREPEAGEGQTKELCILFSEQKRGQRDIASTPIAILASNMCRPYTCACSGPCMLMNSLALEKSGSLGHT